MKKIFSLLVACLFVTGMWGETVTLTENFSSSNATSDAYNCSSSASTAANQTDWDYAWAPVSGYVFKSGIRIGTGSAVGSLTNSTMLAGIPTGTEVTIQIYAAQWNTDGKNIKVTYNGSSETKAPSNAAITTTSNTYSADDFATSTDFTITKANTVVDLVIATSGKGRVFIDKIVVSYTKSGEDTPTLSSVVVSGTPTKTTYTEGEVFDPAGLTVTGKYSDNTEETISSNIDWAITPSTGLPVGTTSVSVVATVEAVSSESYTVTGLTVTPLPKYTITLADDNTTLTQANAGESVILPSRAAIGDYSFAGWSESNIAEETTTVPTIIEAGAYKPTASIPLYPVYTRSTGAGEKTVSVKVADYAAAHEWDVLSSGSATKEYCKYEIVLDANVTATTNDNSTNGAVYADGWRIYQSFSGAVTISTTAGSLSSVKFTYTNGNSGQLFYGDSQLTSATAKAVTGTEATFNVIRTGSTNTNGQVKITAIEVTYIDGVTYYISAPATPVSAKTIDFIAAGTDGYYTTFSHNKAVTIPEMIAVGEEYAQFTVYSIVAVGNEIELQDLTSTLLAENTLYLSENEGYLIKAEFTGEVAYTGEAAFSVEYTELDYDLNGQDEDNALRPASEAKASGKKYYMLAYSNSTCTPASLGFYWGAANGAAFVSRDHSAYLAVEAEGAPARFVFNETTALENKAEAVKANKTLVNGQLFILRDGKTFDVVGRIVK